MEVNKKRILRDIKSGKRKSIGENVFTKYNWTVDETNFLRSYVNTHDPYKIHNNTIEPTYFTKKEVYELLDNRVTNTYTLRNYKSRVNTLMSLMEINNERFSDVFRNTETLIQKIKDKYKDPTAYFGFILFIIDKCQKLLDVIPKNTFDIIKQQFEYFKNVQTLKQLKDREEDIGFEEVYKTIFEKEKSYAKNEYASMKHIIALLYTHALYDEKGSIHINPRNYFVNVKVIPCDSKMNNNDNFYNYHSGRLVLNQYKTSGIYEPYDVIFNTKTKVIINDSLKKTPRTFLVEKQEGGVYASNSLSEMIKRVLGYNIDTIRKSIESYEINIKKMDRIHLANVSRHSLVTQEVSYLSK